MNVRVLSTVGVIAALTLSACGSSSPKTLTKAEWVTQATAICKDLNTRSRAVAPNTQAEIGAAMTKVSEIASEDIPKIAALKPPAEIQADVTALIAAFNQVNSAIKAAGVQASGGDLTGALKAVRASETALKPTITALGTRLGLTDCSKGN